MFIVSGAYHFWPKRVAFRDDYCLTCQAPRRSIAVRTFDVGYIYWIPFLASRLLETLEMYPLWSRSPRQPEDSTFLQVGRLGLR